MIYLKKILTKTKKTMYMLVVYDVNDPINAQKIFLNEDLGLMLIDKYNFEVR